MPSLISGSQLPRNKFLSVSLNPACLASSDDKEGVDLLEIRAAMRRLGLDPNDEEQIRKYFEQHADDKFVKHYLGKHTER